MRLLLAEIFGVADRRDGRVEIAFDFVANVFGPSLSFSMGWWTVKFGMLQTVVGDGVGAECAGWESLSSCARPNGRGRPFPHLPCSHVQIPFEPCLLVIRYASGGRLNLLWTWCFCFPL